MTIWAQRSGWSNEKKFFVDIVLENYVDFLNEFETEGRVGKLALRLGWNSAIATYHFREHLEFSMSVDDICIQCKEYRVLRDLVTAIKHKGAKSAKSGLREVSFDTITAIQFNPNSILEGPTGIYFSIPLYGTDLSLEKVLDTVLDYWISILNSAWGASMERSQLIKIVRENRL